MAPSLSLRLRGSGWPAAAASARATAARPCAGDGSVVDRARRCRRCCRRRRGVGVQRSRARRRPAARRCDSRGAAPASSCRPPATGGVAVGAEAQVGEARCCARSSPITQRKPLGVGVARDAAPARRGRAGSGRAPGAARRDARGSSSRCQSSRASWFHSRSWPNSPPMNSSFLPGWRPHEAEIGAQVGEAAASGRPASCRAASPCRSTTSSCDSGSTKCSETHRPGRRSCSSWW